MMMHTDSGAIPPVVHPLLSLFSTSSIGNAAWSSLDFMVGAGMVIIQCGTHRLS
ncbi:hypothetical protein CPB84DRAFT_1903091 [Gymnopilus junonius]|uniref:Uncharacterized protein n=1 Tax=Gymnopilus junonius TaxID=109634 RepID=A0A9P5TGC9_GYMJU|nr:hypothetical protein CPB84DRAFT_1903091 [Gymnopilus junonius]